MLASRGFRPYLKGAVEPSFIRIRRLEVCVSIRAGRMVEASELTGQALFARGIHVSRYVRTGNRKRQNTKGRLLQIDSRRLGVAAELRVSL